MPHLTTDISYSRMLIADPEAHVRHTEWRSEVRAAWAALWEAREDADVARAIEARIKLRTLCQALEDLSEAMLVETETRAGALGVVGGGS